MYQLLDEKQEIYCGLSDQIWDYAETAFEEFRSADDIKKVLSENGFMLEENLAGIATAFCGTYGAGGPVIGILAEYDALSGLSQKACSVERTEISVGGNGHGCGHNVFGAASVAAAIAVKEYLDAKGLPGTVKLFGCPGEEGGSGKAFMAKQHAFDSLDAALAWHPMAVNMVFDMCLLANYQVLYKFKGLAAHAAAAPHLGRSALDAVELMNVGANFLREHVIQEARIHYAITNSGGFSPNVVQPYAEVLYLIRAPKTPQVEEIYQRVNKIAQGAALMTESEVDIQFIKACANVVPNKVLGKVLYDNFLEQTLPHYSEEETRFAAEIAGTVQHSGSDLQRIGTLTPTDLRRCKESLAGKNICDIVLPFYEDGQDVLLAGSSDVGDVSWNVPTAQITTACYALGTPEHSWQLVSQGRSSIAHKGLMLAAKTMAGAAVDLFEDKTLIDKAKEELAERLAGDVYKSAIPDGVEPQPISKL